MARWKARVKCLLSVVEVVFLSLAVEALQGKMCQNSLPSGGVGHLEPRFQEKGSSLRNMRYMSLGCGLGWPKDTQAQSYSPGGASVCIWEGTWAPPGEYD